MKYKESKISKFLSGKGFYFVLAGCLVATGVAAWTAYASFTQPDTAKTPENSSYIASSKEAESDPVQTETESKEPYSSSSDVTSSEDAPIISEPVVAEHFVYPLSGTVTKEYSESEPVYSKTFGDMRVHTGLDIKAERGTAVNACGNGIVVAVIEDDMLGKYVEVDHGNGIVARYCGLSENVSVKEGNIVSAGTKLGLLDGSPCESEDESHLHLEFYKDEFPVNPKVIIEG